MNTPVKTGLVLGILGAALDFNSGYLFVSQSVMMTNDMGVMTTHFDVPALEWGVVLFSLGALILGTSLVSATLFGMQRMRSFGVIMAVYGIAMLVIGSIMYSGMTPMMTGSTFSSIGMFAVGALMVINGVLMINTLHGGMKFQMKSVKETQAGQQGDERAAI
ncbi:MAG: hypothetical protein ACRECH_02485 [Nitrososphaerales archaeon]